MNKFKRISIFSIIFLLGLTGYVSAKTGTIDAPNGLVLREEASKVSNPILTLSDDAEVEIIEESGEWYKVKYGDQEGYVFGEYVIVKEEPVEITELSENAPTDGIIEPTEQTPAETEPETIYPQTITTISSVKVYIMPSITSSVINTISEGTTVTIERALNKWLYISTDSLEGWVREYPLKNVITTTTTEPENTETPTTTEPEENTEEHETVETSTDTTPSITEGYISVDAANVRETASTSAEIVTTLTLNTKVNILAETDEWYKIEYESYRGYIAKRLISETATATSRSTTEIRQDNTQTNTTLTTSATSATGNAIVDFAMQFKGNTAYVYGGTTPETGFDCSGFTYYVYNSCGYNISRSCSAQTHEGREVSKEELQPGDLLLFDNTSDGSIGHVGIYTGDGNFIHAANSRRGIVIDTILRDYYYTYYYSARRIAE